MRLAMTMLFHPGRLRPAGLFWIAIKESGYCE
jgi:hypothetical protein